MYVNCMPDIMILAQVVLQMFCSQWLRYYTIHQSQERERIQLNNYRIMQNVNQVITQSHNLYAKYHDPRSSGSPDILFTRFHRFTKQKSKKEHNSAMTSPTEKKN